MSSRQICGCSPALICAVALGAETRSSWACSMSLTMRTASRALAHPGRVCSSLKPSSNLVQMASGEGRMSYVEWAAPLVSFSTTYLAQVGPSQSGKSIVFAKRVPFAADRYLDFAVVYWAAAQHPVRRAFLDGRQARNRCSKFVRRRTVRRELEPRTKADSD